MPSVIDDLIRAAAQKNASSPPSWADDDEEQEESTMDSLHPSIPRPTDEYDHLGRNVTAMQRHQNLVPWILVKYDSHGRRRNIFDAAW